MMPNKQKNSAPMLSVTDALAAILGHLPYTDTQTISLKPGLENLGPENVALGAILAEDLTAVLTLPPQAVSAMDGYAVRGVDVASMPASLTRIAESAAGHPWSGKISAGQAVRVFTGAAIPDGADTIVIQEDVDPVAEEDGAVITIRNAEPIGRYIRPAGLDVRAGEIILPAGSLLTSRAIGLAIAAGLTHAIISKKPRVGILSTGDELVEPGNMPGPGQIISSNASFLASFVTACGAEAVNLGIARDQPRAMLGAVRAANKLDLIVTTGGASVGTHDHIVRDLAAAAGTNGTDDAVISSGLNFWKIAMRPGKPLISGFVDGIPLIGLPGNPVSTAICALVFLGPALAHMCRGSVTTPSFDVALSVPLDANDQRQDYIRAVLENDDQGQSVRPAPRQDSSMMSVLAQANALIIRPPFEGARAAGDRVTVMLLPHLY